MNYINLHYWIFLIAILVSIIIATCSSLTLKQNNFSLSIVVPAASQKQFFYAEQAISPLADYIIINSGNGLSDTEVLLTRYKHKQKLAINLLISLLVYH